MAQKVIFQRKDTEGNVIPDVVLGAFENNLDVTISCHPDHSKESNITHECKVPNIPLQKWVNLIVV